MMSDVTNDLLTIIAGIGGVLVVASAIGFVLQRRFSPDGGTVARVTWTVTVKKGTYRTGTGSSDVSTDHTPGVRFGMFIDAATPWATDWPWPSHVQPSTPGGIVALSRSQYSIAARPASPAPTRPATSSMRPPSRSASRPAVPNAAMLQTLPLG